MVGRHAGIIAARATLARYNTARAGQYAGFGIWHCVDAEIYQRDVSLVGYGGKYAVLDGVCTLYPRLGRVLLLGSAKCAGGLLEVRGAVMA